MPKQRYLEAGKIVSVFGIKGEVNVQCWCDSPELLCQFNTLYYKSLTPVEIEHSRPKKNNMVTMKIKGVDTPEDAQTLRNRILYLDREELELPKGSYFIQDLIGMSVEDSTTGEVYGKISDVSETGANDVYHIKTEEGKILLVPAIPQVVDSVDLENDIMKITPLEGLFDI